MNNYKKNELEKIIQKKISNKFNMCNKKDVVSPVFKILNYVLLYLNVFFN